MLLAVDVGNTNTVLGVFRRRGSPRTGGSRPSRSAPPTSTRCCSRRCSTSRASRGEHRRRDHLVGRAAGGVRRSSSFFKRAPRRPAARRRPGHQDRHADPLREPARGRRRSHRQRGRRVRAMRKAAASSSTSAPRRRSTCVTPKGEYLGGVIAPGIQISAEALYRARREAAARRARAAAARSSARNTVHVDAVRPRLRLRRHGRRARRAHPRRGRLPGALHRDRRARAADRDRDARRSRRPTSCSRSRASRSCITATHCMMRRTPRSICARCRRRRRRRSVRGRRRMMAARGMMPLPRRRSGRGALPARARRRRDDRRRGARDRGGPARQAARRHARATRRSIRACSTSSRALVADKPAVFDALVLNPAIADETIATLAGKGDAREVDLIAQNEQRLLRASRDHRGDVHEPERAHVDGRSRRRARGAQPRRVPGLAAWDEVARGDRPVGRPRRAGRRRGRAVRAGVAVRASATQPSTTRGVEERSPRTRRVNQAAPKTTRRSRPRSASCRSPEDPARHARQRVRAVGADPGSDEAGRGRGDQVARRHRGRGGTYAGNRASPTTSFASSPSKEWTRLYGVKHAPGAEPEDAAAQGHPHAAAPAREGSEERREVEGRPVGGVRAGEEARRRQKTGGEEGEPVARRTAVVHDAGRRWRCSAPRRAFEMGDAAGGRAGLTDVAHAVCCVEVRLRRGGALVARSWTMITVGFMPGLGALRRGCSRRSGLDLVVVFVGGALVTLAAGRGAGPRATSISPRWRGSRSWSSRWSPSWCSARRRARRRGRELRDHHRGAAGAGGLAGHGDPARACAARRARRAAACRPLSSAARLVGRGLAACRGAAGPQRRVGRAELRPAAPDARRGDVAPQRRRCRSSRRQGRALARRFRRQGRAGRLLGHLVQAVRGDGAGAEAALREVRGAGLRGAGR